MKIEEDCRFETESGAASLKDLFRGRSQLLVYHVMFGPDHAAGCPSCSFIIEDGAIHHAYSTYSRGLDSLWGAYPWLGRAPKGRNEDGPWWKRHHEYPA